MPQGSKTHCYYCQTRMIEPTLLPGKKPTPFDRTKDHYIAASQGGKKKVWACFRCNQYKGNMPPEQFEALIRELGGNNPLLRAACINWKKLNNPHMPPKKKKKRRKKSYVERALADNGGVCHPSRPFD